MMQIDLIRADGGTQSRAAINEETVAEYAEAMADVETAFPPVTIFYDGKTYWLADGFHRVEAAKRAGRTEIAADIQQGDQRRAILHSVAANSRHGLRRTNADKRRAVMTLLQDDEWSQWSDREIARRCGVSPSFVGGLRGVSVHDGQIDAPRTVERNGTIYQQDTSNIGARKPVVQPDVATSGHDEQFPQPELGDPQPQEPEQPDPHAKLRREFRAMTDEAREDDWIGLREEVAELRKRVTKQRGEIADLKTTIAELTSADDAGRKIGNLQRRLSQSEGRSSEHQKNAARLQRQVNAQKAQIDILNRRLESQEIVL